MNGGETPATKDCERGKRLAVWQTGLSGLAWLDELVRQGSAIDLGGDGYPCWYTVTAEQFAARIEDGLPGANAAWVHGPADIILEGWEGKTVIDRAEVARCHPHEWLLVEAWDES